MREQQPRRSLLQTILVTAQLLIVGSLSIGEAKSPGSLEGACYTLERTPSIAACEKLKDITPSDGRPHKFIGDALYESGRVTESIASYEKAVTLNPNYYQAYNNLAKALWVSGDLDRARESFSKAIVAISFAMEAEENHPRLYENRGTLLTELEQYDQAIEDFNKAIELSPTSSDAFYGRGNAFAGKRQRDKAIDDFTEAIRLNSRNLEAYVNRGVQYDAINEDDLAIADYTSALKIDANDHISYVNRSSSWAFKGDFRKALQDCRRARALLPKDPWTMNSCGLAWAAKGDRKKAIAEFSTAISVSSNFSYAFYNRANQHLEMKDLNRALEDYNAALRIDPQFSQAYINRGLVYSELGDPNKAVEDFRKSIEIEPTEYLAFNNLGVALFELNEVEKAINAFTEALKINSKDSRAYTNRGEAWARLGEHDKAVVDFTSALQRSPSEAEVYFDRGNSWIEKNDFDSATSDFRAALKIDRGFKNAEEALRLLEDRKKRAKEKSLAPALPAAPLPIGTSGLVSSGNGVLGSVEITKTSGKRVALVIGNSSYKEGFLKNPVRDAQLIEKRLLDSGFDDVVLKLNLDRTQTLESLKRFETVAETADWAVIYFAGHGIEVDGVNYMIPVSSVLTEKKTIAEDTVNIEYFLRATEAANKVRLVILDACRDNPFKVKLRAAKKAVRVRGLSVEGAAITSGAGLARIEPQPGTLVVYSAKSGEYASDGDGENSPFALALAKRMDQLPPLEVRRLFDFVREDVFQQTRTTQQPFAYGNLRAAEDFFFRPPEKNDGDQKK
jgi:tetratricopeptide (TPR) repeat protein